MHAPVAHSARAVSRRREYLHLFIVEARGARRVDDERRHRVYRVLALFEIRYRIRDGKRFVFLLRFVGLGILNVFYISAVDGALAVEVRRKLVREREKRRFRQVGGVAVDLLNAAHQPEPRAVNECSRNVVDALIVKLDDARKLVLNIQLGKVRARRERGGQHFFCLFVFHIISCSFTRLYHIRAFITTHRTLKLY